jgi:hypothetical protein
MSGSAATGTTLPAVTTRSGDIGGHWAGRLPAADLTAAEEAGGVADIVSSGPVAERMPARDEPAARRHV